MDRILQVISRKDDTLAESVLAAHQDAGADVRVIRLDAEAVDYEQLLEAVFAADRVQSW